MAEFDAEKIARAIVDEYVCQLHAAERKGLYGQIMRAFTTARNEGLERAAEIAAHKVSGAYGGLSVPRFRDGELAAQAIRREIK